MPAGPQQNPPNLKFIFNTTATILSLDLVTGGAWSPLVVNNGTAEAFRSPGTSSIAVLRLGGPIGTTAKFKIVQSIGGVDVILTERNFIKITSAAGQTTANINFTVR